MLRGLELPITEAHRHADGTGHVVEVKIDAILTVYPNTEDAEEDDHEEDDEDDQEEDDVEWVGAGDCENCFREDVDLAKWAGSVTCTDCLVLGTLVA